MKYDVSFNDVINFSGEWMICSVTAVRISNYIQYQVCDEITLCSQTSNVQLLKFGNG